MWILSILAQVFLSVRFVTTVNACKHFIQKDLHWIAKALHGAANQLACRLIHNPTSNRSLGGVNADVEHHIEENKRRGETV